MGWYIQGPTIGKAPYIVMEYGATVVGMPGSFSDIPEDKALIVVVGNPMFEAAGYAFDEREFDTFTRPEDVRQKLFLLMDKKKAIKLTGFKENNEMSGTKT